jgi:hypothetical protein
MLNRDGISTSTYGAPKQILANVDLQSSVGCIVAQAVGTNVGAKKIAKAGTPIKIDMGNLQTPATAETEGNNAVLLHDVDVTDGNANGTALVFGFVNVNRLESDVQAKVTPGTAVGMVQFIKF